jgi:acyl-coenzyme A synthetase/AMP-(fatty) acid ligase
MQKIGGKLTQIEDQLDGKNNGSAWEEAVGLREGDMSFYHGMNQVSNKVDMVVSKQNETAVILYTSGTTWPQKDGLLPVTRIIVVLPFVRYCQDLLPQDMYWGFADTALGESAVVRKPGELRGKVVKAFVVLKESFPATDNLKEELGLFVRNRLAQHKLPQRSRVY